MSLKSQGFKRYFLLIIVGGALGNLHDRIFFKAVPDFIDFHVGNFHWFIFNVSDIFITLGVIGMIFFELLNKENENR
jgi:signal peptidase II